MKCAVDELVGDDEIGGLVLLFERTHGGDRDDALDAKLLESVDVCPEIEFRGKYAVPLSMARQERNADGPRVRRATKGSEGSPKGVSTCSSWTLVNPGIE